MYAMSPRFELSKEFTAYAYERWNILWKEKLGFAVYGTNCSIMIPQSQKLCTARWMWLMFNEN